MKIDIDTTKTKFFQIGSGDVFVAHGKVWIKLDEEFDHGVRRFNAVDLEDGSVEFIKDDFDVTPVWGARVCSGA